MSISSRNGTVERPKDVLKSVTKALSILELLNAHPAGLLPKEVAHKLDINLGTCYHQLNTLLYVGYVQRDDAEGVFRLSHKIKFRRPRYFSAAEVIRLLRPHLSNLQEITQETAYLSLWDRREIYVADIVPSPQSIQVKLLQVGYSEANHAMALGKAILAYVDEPARREYLQHHPLEPYTNQTVTDIDMLYTQLRHVFCNGYSTDHEERFTDIFCLGVPVFGIDDGVIAALAITTPKYRFDANFDQFLRYLKQSGTAASRTLAIAGCGVIEQ